MRERDEPLMEALPETREALDELERSSDEGLVTQFDDSAQLLRRLVPGCVGVSLSVVEEGLTFTWISAGEDTPGLDAVQYLDGGPCVEAVGSADVVDVTRHELLDEERWLMFAQAERVAGVQSSLSMPIMRDDRVVGGINLYGAEPDTFAGRHQGIADIFGAWVPGVVTNADLSFSTRDRARRAPSDLHDQAVVNQAVGMIVAAHAVGTTEAREELRAAADRAGLTEAEVAAFVVRTHLL